MSSNERNYEFEYYEKYYGGIQRVKKIIEECHDCGGRLFFIHQADTAKMLMKESAHCPDCGEGKHKVISKTH